MRSALVSSLAVSSDALASLRHEGVDALVSRPFQVHWHRLASTLRAAPTLATNVLWMPRQACVCLSSDDVVASLHLALGQKICDLGPEPANGSILSVSSALPCRICGPCLVKYLEGGCYSLPSRVELRFDLL